MMPKPLDIIMLPLARWDSPYSSTAYSLAKEFARHNRVFYIENPVTLKFLYTNFRKPEIQNRLASLFLGKKSFQPLSENGNLVAVTTRLTMPVNFLPSGAIYNALSALNDKIIFSTVRKLIEEYDVKDYIFLNSFNPFYLRKFPSFFTPKLFIYHTVDDISHASHVRKHGPVLENEAIRKADLTFTTSKELRRLKSSISDHIYLLANAADVSLFKTSLSGNFTRPSEIKNIDVPIIIYTGHIDHRINFDLLISALKVHTDKLFLMVGPVASNVTLDQFDAYSNILFIGNKDIGQLPSYLHFASCAIIPFKCNTLTKSIYPLKVNEYLAAGLPVVSTPFSDDILDFKEVIEIGDEAQAFSNGITSAFAGNTIAQKEKRVAVAESNTWQARVKLFWEITNGYLKSKER